MRRFTVAAVAVLVLSGSPSEGRLGSGSLFGAEEAHAARWIGSLEGKAERSNRFASGGSTSHGDFWFNVGRGGRVTGEAVIAYEPSFNADGLNAFISYVQSLASVPAGAIPGFGGLVASQITTAISVRVSYPEPMAIRRVPISGTLRGGRLTLHGSRGALKGVPFRAFLTRVDSQKPVTSGRLAIPPPFPEAAQVRGGHATSSLQTQSGSETREQTSSYWTAHRVGKG